MTDQPKMNPEIKAKWVAALRSGEFKQAREYLRVGDRYCCLGVLCKVQGLRITKDGKSVYDGSRSNLEYGPIWDIVGEEAARDLAMRNDGSVCTGITPHSFDEIADYIEANL